LVRFMVSIATFGNILVISWRSVLLVEETGVQRENHRPVASHGQTLSHNVVHLALIEIRTHWNWSYDSWIYNYLCNQCLSPLLLWVRISIRARCTTLCDKVCQWLVAGRWFFPGPPISSTNNKHFYDIFLFNFQSLCRSMKQLDGHYRK
jgi:hypothetical protein